jgi:hypothetical protein
MSTVEQGQLDPQWEKTINLRPHHVFGPETINAVRQNKNYIRSFLIEIAYRLGPIVDESGYFIDLLGESGRDVSKKRRSENKFHETIRLLPDEAVVHLDMSPDELCKSCVVGKHCFATNLDVNEFGGKVNTAEQKAINQIHISLLQNGYKEGEDFIFQQTSHVVFDYHNQNLYPSQTPTETSVEINSMLVKMGALRKAVRTIVSKGSNS